MKTPNWDKKLTKEELAAETPDQFQRRMATIAARSQGQDVMALAECSPEILKHYMGEDYERPDMTFMNVYVCLPEHTANVLKERKSTVESYHFGPKV